MNIYQGFSYESLTTQERLIHNRYKEGDDAYEVNKKLREGIALNTDEMAMVQMLDQIIKKYQHPTDIILHRAACQNCVDGFVDKKDIYSCPSFMSTAINQYASFGHLKCDEESGNYVLMEIHCPAGTYMAPMDTNPIYGESEREMLLGRKGFFKILSKEELDNEPQIKRILINGHSIGVNHLTTYVMEFIRYDP